MNYKPSLKQKSEALITSRRWGIGIITTLLGAGMLLSELDRIRESWPNIMVICYVALFALTGVLVWLWVWATRNELAILWRWLDPKRYTPPSSLRETTMITLLGVLLSALFFASRDVFLYALLFSIYSLINLYATWYLNKEISSAVQKSKQRLGDELRTQPDDRRLLLYSSAIDELEHYFIKLPHQLRHVAILMFSIGALIVAYVAGVRSSAELPIVAYVIVFMTIVISEIVIAVWRIQRDDRLRTFEAEVNDLERPEVS